MNNLTISTSRSPLSSPFFITIVAWVILAVFVFGKPNLGGDPGLGWHLKTGEVIVSTLSIPRTDPFLLNFENHPWICNQWLGDVLLYGIFSCFSWLGVHVFSFIIGFSAFVFVLAGSAYDSKQPAVPQNLAFALAILCGVVHWISRPVVFSLLGFALTDALIRAHRQKTISDKNFVLLSIPLFIAWANLHPAFILGLVLLCLYVVTEFFSGSPWRIPAIALAVSILASACNPYGFNLHLAIAELGSSTYFMNLNSEWRPPTPASPIFWPFYIAIFCGLFGSLKISQSPFDTAKALFFAVCAFKAARFLPFFGIAAFPSLATALTSIFSIFGVDKFFSNSSSSTASQKHLTAVLPGIVLAIAVLLVRPHGEEELGIGALYPLKAINYAFNDDRLPVLHTPNWGGPVIWSTYPRRVARIDDRNELNGEQRYKDFIAMENLGEGWKEIFDKGAFVKVLIDPHAPLVSILTILPEWRKTFEDKRAIVFERITTPSHIQ